MNHENNIVWDSLSEECHDAFFDSAPRYYAAKNEFNNRRVFDESGSVCLVVPSSIPDKAIGDLLKTHILAYEQGLKQGKSIRSREIKDLLELD